MTYAKVHIPQPVRHAVARRYGAEPGRVTSAVCAYCGAAGRLVWDFRRRDGSFSQWLVIQGLELDHIIPERVGGLAEPTNLVLACPSCNRSKGARSRAAPVSITERSVIST